MVCYTIWKWISESTYTPGWISGVYLNILEKEEPPNGAIQFSFNDGKYFSDDNNKTPLKTINPKIGDVILFPSSLYHRTIPTKFSGRMVVAFDLLK